MSEVSERERERESMYVSSCVMLYQYCEASHFCVHVYHIVYSLLVFKGYKLLSLRAVVLHISNEGKR